MNKISYENIVNGIENGAFKYPIFTPSKKSFFFLRRQDDKFVCISLDGRKTFITQKDFESFECKQQIQPRKKLTKKESYISGIKSEFDSKPDKINWEHIAEVINRITFESFAESLKEDEKLRELIKIEKEAICFCDKNTTINLLTKSDFESIKNNFLRLFNDSISIDDLADTLNDINAICNIYKSYKNLKDGKYVEAIGGVLGGIILTPFPLGDIIASKLGEFIGEKIDEKLKINEKIKNQVSNIIKRIYIKYFVDKELKTKKK